jgi:hypothetical protein
LFPWEYACDVKQQNATMPAINKYLICFPFYVISQLITPLSLQKLCGMSYVTNMFFPIIC